MEELADQVNREEIMDKVQALVLKGLGDTDARVYLFGSWARGTNQRTSDIDIALEHRGDVTPYLVAKIRDLLEESSIPFNVDVVDLTQAGEGLIKNVKREGLLWRDYTSD